VPISGASASSGNASSVAINFDVRVAIAETQPSISPAAAA
jgi:hypothetical protein